MKRFILLLSVVILLAGCGAGFFSAATRANVTIGADGSRTFVYESQKEQQGLVLDVQETDGKVTGVHVKVDKADTQQEAIAAALQTQLGLQEILKSLIAAGIAAPK